MKLKTVLLFLYIIISFFLFATFKSNTLVWISFFINFSFLTIITYYHLYFEKDYSPFISAYIVFNYLFFFVAPIIQIGNFSIDSGKKYMTNFPYTDELTLKTNALIFLFHVIFFLSYFSFKKNAIKNLSLKKEKEINPVLPLTILILLLISITIFIFTYGFVLDEFSRPSWKETSYSIFSLLLHKKVLFMIPFGCIILCFEYFKYRKKLNFNSSFILSALIVMLLLLIWFKNPMTEKRNALGPIYIALLFLFYPKLLNSNIKTTLFLFISMVILFPLAQIFTHIDFSFQQILNNPKLLFVEITNAEFVSTFNTLNYDAFSNIAATIEYTTVNGFSYGYQLLSGLLFFIPRSIWISKPNNTGQMIGEYIKKTYDFDFTNLSNPLVSEGYLNFGYFGVILMAVVLAYFVVKFLLWLQNPDELKRIMAFYFAIHLIFFLRGDFTNGFVYYIGTFIGVLIIPKFVNSISRELIKK